jgi:hypothetical protein
MRKNKPLVLMIALVVAGLALLGLLTWGNYRFAKASPGGNDFLVHWVGTRSLVLEGLNPYSDEVAGKIQTCLRRRLSRASTSCAWPTRFIR